MANRALSYLGCLQRFIHTLEQMAFLYCVDRQNCHMLVRTKTVCWNVNKMVGLLCPLINNDIIQMITCCYFGYFPLVNSFQHVNRSAQVRMSSPNRKSLVMTVENVWPSQCKTKVGILQIG